MAIALAVLAVVVGSLWRHPPLTHCLWVLVLLKLLTPPLFLVPLSWPGARDQLGGGGEPAAQRVAADAAPDKPVPAREGEAAGPVMADIAPEGAEPAANGPPAEDQAGPPAEEIWVAVLPPKAADAPRLDLPAWETFWLPVVVTLWLGGSLSWFALAGARIVRFHRLLRHGQPAPPGMQEQARKLARRLGLARCPTVWLLPGAVSPLLWTVFGPGRVVVPAGLLDHLDAEQQATLLAHELAHLRRRDSWIRCLEFVVLGLYWWHPVVWWARREIREAEELCCDAWVVWALPGAARSYATALIDTVDYLAEARPALPPMASGVGHFQNLKRRLIMIMRGTSPQTLTCAGFLAVVVLGVVLLPLMPTLARTEQPQPPGDRGDPPRRGGDRDPDLAKAREEVKALADQIERLRAELETKAKALAAAEDRLNRAKARLDQRQADPRARNRGDRGARPEPRPSPRGAAGPEQRMQILERKLDLLIREVEALRNELRGGRAGDRKRQPPAAGQRPPAARRNAPAPPAPPEPPGKRSDDGRQKDPPAPPVPPRSPAVS
jgi:beta-lactamase regulating signal transducer with metallopeptidase domain